jgi:hypothetical protein
MHVSAHGEQERRNRQPRQDDDPQEKDDCKNVMADAERTSEDRFQELHTIIQARYVRPGVVGLPGETWLPGRHSQLGPEAPKFVKNALVGINAAPKRTIRDWYRGAQSNKQER